MAELWGVLGALASVVLPLVLAWWLVGRTARDMAERSRERGKMPPEKGP